MESSVQRRASREGGPERSQRPHSPPHRDGPRTQLDQPIEHLQQRGVDSRLPTASHPTGCQWQSTERLPRRLVTGPVMPNQPQALMPSPPGVRHLGCTKAFLRNLFFGLSQSPQFPPAQLERHILDGEEFARTETVCGVESRGSRVEGFFPRRAGVARCASKRCVLRIYCKPACEWPSKNSPESGL